MAPLIFIGAALGGAAMYFFDPDKGRRRRALVRDQAVKASTDARDFVNKGKRDLVHRGAVVKGRVRSIFKRRSATDEVLVERVRSAMGRFVAHPGAVDVTAADGRITLSGSILSHEQDELIEGVSAVAGVREVIDRLNVYEKAQGISELQGGGREPSGTRSETLQENWAPGTRLMTGAAGTTLTLYALARHNRFAGFVAFATGVALLARTVSNKPLRRLASGEGGAIDVRKTIHIEAPVSKVFEFLSNYDNFPSFMRNILSVDTFPDGRSHWKVAGPAGAIVEWDAITTRIEPENLIEWSTIAGSPVEHAGTIRIAPFGGGAHVHVQMSYNPPAGAFGHMVAKLFRADPKSELDQDLMRLKSTLETGKLPSNAAQLDTRAKISA
jgi:uncharacterized membrane protein